MRRLIVTMLAVLTFAASGAVADQRMTGSRLIGQSVKADTRQAQTIINAYRRRHGLSPVALDARLTAAAQAHADDMARNDTMSHSVSYGNLPRRMASAGLRPRLAAENVSAGYKTTGRAIAGWQGSPAHNRNLLMAGVSRMGLAAAYQPQSRYKYYWTLILAAD